MAYQTVLMLPLPYRHQVTVGKRKPTFSKVSYSFCRKATANVCFSCFCRKWGVIRFKINIKTICFRLLWIAWIFESTFQLTWLCMLFTSGDSYYQYEFKHQPSHGECVQMSVASSSLLFTRYTDLFFDRTWEDFFSVLFESSGKLYFLRCPCVSVHMSLTISSWPHIQSVVSTQALVSPVGTGRASCLL